MSDQAEALRAYVAQNPEVKQTAWVDAVGWCRDNPNGTRDFQTLLSVNEDHTGWYPVFPSAPPASMVRICRQGEVLFGGVLGSVRAKTDLFVRES